MHTLTAEKAAAIDWVDVAARTNLVFQVGDKASEVTDNWFLKTLGRELRRVALSPNPDQAAEDLATIWRARLQGKRVLSKPELVECFKSALESVS